MKSPLRYVLTQRKMILFFSLIIILTQMLTVQIAQADCDSPANEIVAENCLTGNPASEWDVSGAGDENIQGYATDISVDQGETIEFKVDTDATDYRLDIYRLGYYDGDGARFITTVDPSTSLPQTQPACLFDGTDAVNLVDCGNWAVSASWSVPVDAVSGIYIAKLVREDATSGASHITFIVRDDDGNSDLLFQTADATWHAYNGYGGYSLYEGPGHAHKVSYNRPFSTRTSPTEDFLFNSEYPMLRWLERNGYDVSYFTNVDADRFGSEILEHQVFLSVGHDEYWSATQRTAVETARDAGVHLAFFSGNEVYWKTRWENSIDGANIPYRTLVSYKEGSLAGSEHYDCLGNNACDPHPTEWTGLWRDGCGVVGHDGCNPENALTGTISWDGTTGTLSIPSEFGNFRFWRNTTVESLPSGTDATLTPGTLGYEWDFEQPLYEDSYPDGRILLSTTDFNGRTHHLSLYRASSGALVFGVGTVQWAWGLDSTHDRGSDPADPDMQQSTVNLFADMGVQPANLDPALTPAAASTDTIAPTSTILSPADGSTVESNTAVTLSGTAVDIDGVVGAVEISTDSGVTWQTTTGRETWTYVWTPTTLGSTIIQSRAVDDSGNIETPSASITLNVVERVCPCSIWNDTIIPTNPDANDGDSIEVGLKFQANEPGSITGVRFYKDIANTGTHTGHLWAADGTQLAEAIFVNETASGWQEVYFATPVDILANTTYVVSYYSIDGGYAHDDGYFATAFDSSPLRALADGEDGGNGVYKYGVSGFPTTTFQSSNYWVDVIFDNTPQIYSIWDQGAITGNPAVVDPNPIEVGTKFKSDVAGTVTGVVFYKGATNTGSFLGHLWDLSGTQLAEKSYTNSTTEEGWQEVIFDTPVSINVDTTYIISYFTQSGNYAAASSYFTAEIYNEPLRALANSDPDGPNGVYHPNESGFPTDTFNSNNYWVDVLFTPDTPIDTTLPNVLSVTPANGTSGVNVNNNITARFSEAMDAVTVNGSTVELRDAGNNLVLATVSYNGAALTATLDPDAALAYSTTYTAVVKGGTGGVADLAGNEMAVDYTWTFTTSAPLPPPPEEGPGGPILVVTSAGNPFGTYFAEILRTEGFNAFAVEDITNVDAILLTNYDVVILGEMSLTSPQVTLFTDWVTAGGNLITMRPDAQLSGLLGLTDSGGTLANAYLLVDTASGPGVGIVNETIQFHDTADLYTLNGATALATLYSDATTATANPAVTLIDVGTNGGQAAAFTYDLAKSVVYTRQGNSAWADINGDGSAGPVRADDMFHNGTDPDWVDLNKVAIPQADEQQRLLANLILQTNLDKMPLPRFWYFPRGEKAVVVMTSDNHASPNVPGRLDQYLAFSPAGCSVDDWECIRSSVYIYPGTTLSESQANAYTADGFEIGVHILTDCANYTLTELENFYNVQLSDFATRFPGLPLQDSERTHCIAWSGWDYQPTVKEQLGIRLDTNYYFWPPEWVNDRPGLFTGSGMPMRFAALDGTMFDVYQATTQMTDESGQSYPFTIDTLINRALGAEGYYGVFTANMHSDNLSSPGSDAIVASAQSNEVPVVSGRQLLTWLDGRNGSSFANLTWSANTLSFEIQVGAGANGLQAMVPSQASGNPVSGITINGTSVSYTLQTIKGITYAFFDADAGTVNVSYITDNTSPTVVSFSPADGATNVPTDSVVSVTFDESMDAATINTTTFELRDAVNNLVSATIIYDDGTHTATLTPDMALDLATAYSVTVVGGASGVTDVAGNPLAADVTWSFTTPDGAFVDTTVTDFTAGTLGACYISETDDGEVILAPTVGEEFTGTALPTGWSSVPWNTGGISTVANGVITVDGARAATDSYYGAGHAIEFVATFQAEQFQHVGFGQDLALGTESWALFGTNDTTDTLFARTLDGVNPQSNIAIAGNWFGTPHLYRIVWVSGQVDFYIDDVLVHSEPVAITADMRPVVSDFTTNGQSVTVDWLRMSPYGTPCTFTSRVFNTGSTANWNTIAWNADLPTAASLSLRYRTGDTAIPDTSWTVFTFVAASPGTLTGSSRYIQYQAVLDTSDDTVTPALRDVTINYASTPDTTPPTVTNRDPAPDALDVPLDTAVSVTFSEPMDTATIDETTFTLRADGAVSDVPAAVFYAGTVATLTPIDPLELGTTYTVLLNGTVSDLAGNPLGADDTWSFTTTLPIETLIDTTVADFTAGTVGSCYISETDDGELILAPTVGEEFTGTALPTGWSSVPWTTGGTSTVANGVITVDGARAATDNVYGAGHAIEFVATFQAESFQHVGFGQDLEFLTESWAMFGTNNTTTTLYARTLHNDVQINTPITGDWFGSSHLYRIVWTTDQVDFYIDGALVHSELVAIAADMRPVISDFTTNDLGVAVDWLHMSPYDAPCTFTSRVFNAGTTANWSTISWNADLPAATSLSLSYRTGDTAIPDASWTTFTAVGASPGTLTGSSRYIQYQAVLDTSDDTVTPSLADVTITYSPTPDTTPPTVTNRDPAPDALDVPLDTAVSVTFSEPMDETTIDETTFTLRAAGAVNDVPTTVSYAGTVATLTPTDPIQPGTIYTVLVNGTVSDQAGNPLGTDDTWSFTTAIPIETLIDTTVADFNAGSGSCMVDPAYSDGALRLALTVDEPFDGTALPSDWNSNPWATGGSAAVSGSTLIVDRAVAGTDITFSPGHTLEFTATFGAEMFQHIGFVSNFDFTGTWAMFSTGGTINELYARTNPGSDVLIPGSWIGTPHLYRIVWQANSVEFYIDGTLVHTALDAITTPMGPVVSDINSDAYDVVIDQIQMTPYLSPCAFESRVFDANDVVDWLDIQWAGITPTGTSVTVETRTGNISVPDGSWSVWEAVDTVGNIVSLNGRYAQYRLNLITTDEEATPIIEEVALRYTVGDTTAPVITILGDNPATVEVGDPYTDAGATAFDASDGDLTVDIVTTSNVNTNTVGSYSVIYDVADSSGNNASAVRTVNVVDTTAPIITILGDNPATVEVGTAYTDAGATAFDTGDGDLTANIVTTSDVDTGTVGSYSVTYDVTDSSSNNATAVRTVNVVDTGAPVITILGDNPATVEVGDSYTDVGATATDDVDGDLTANIVTTSDVDSGTVGSYSVTYDVTDSSGNNATAVRTVNVVDTTAPIITILGDNPATVVVGGTYIDAGATAFDAGDGDLTTDIVTTSTVDINTAGSYSVTYDVTDSSGNIATAVRTVAVQPTGEVTCVTIQRGTEGAVDDSYVWEALPSTNQAGAFSLSTGDRYRNNYGPGETRTLIRFDLNAIPEGSVVESATFGLVVSGGGSGEVISLYRITEPWNEMDGHTWNSIADSYDSTVIWGNFPANGGSATVDITNLVAEWLNGSASNYGVMLINDSGTTRDLYKSSENADLNQRPQLEVCYSSTLGEPTAIELAPTDETVPAGASMAYTVTAVDAMGNRWDVTGSTAFSIDSAAGGSWAGNLYTSENVGTWTITGTYLNLSVNTLLTVNDHGDPVSLTMAPLMATSAAGETITYQTTATDVYGNSWDVTSETAFSIEADAGGSWVANVYTSAVVGDWIVTGSYAGLTTTADLTVEHGIAASLVLDPVDVTISVGADIAYQATASDTFGNDWEVTAETDFVIDAAAGGSWNGNVYTSEQIGVWLVAGEYAGLTGNANLTVAEHGTAVSLTLVPATTNIAAGETASYQALASDDLGNEWDATTETTFSIETAAGGSWTGNTYTSEFTGNWTVSGEYAGLVSTASLTVTPGTAGSLHIEPATDTVISGGSVTYQVTATDSFSNQWDVTTEAVFSIDTGAGGLWEANVYISETVGNWTVTSSYAGLSAIANLEVVSGGEPVCVTVQRGLYGTVEDSYVWESLPNTNLATAYTLSTGDRVHRALGAGDTRSLLYFDLNFLPADASIQSAAFNLFVSGVGTGETISIFNMTEPWNESDGHTWNTIADSYDNSITWAAFVANGGNATTDVTDLVTAWTDGTPNYGMMLINVAGSERDIYTSSDHSRTSQRPSLEVCYLTATAAVTANPHTLTTVADGVALFEASNATLTPIWQERSASNR